MRPFLILAVAVLCGCPPSPSQPDGSIPTADSGVADAGPFTDAGRSDAGDRDAGAKLDAGPADAGFLDVQVADWCQDLALVSCARDARCLRLAAANLAECIATKSQSCDQVAYSRGVGEGRLQFLSSKAAECLNGYDRGSCEQAPATCEGLFIGSVPPDGGCLLPEECDPTGYCFIYDGRCPHHCRPFVGLGLFCDGFNVQCKPNEGYCGSPDAGLTNRCLSLKLPGEDCPTYDACRADLTCANGKCVKRVALPGEPCGERSIFPYCQDEYYCRQDTRTTTPPPGTCEARGGLGAVCAGYGTCLPSLRCGSAFTTSTCVPRAAEGEACSTYGDCQETLYCPTATSRCAKLPADGGDCTPAGSSYQCASTHFCDFNAPGGLYTCQARRALGEACTYSQGCLSNTCEYGPLPDGGYAGSCAAGCSQKADGGF